MRAPVSSVLLLLFCCAVVLAQTAAPVATPAVANADELTTGAISGSVVNESGQPFAGVQVFVRPINTTVPGRTVFTDSEGTFRINGLAAALYAVSASAPGYVLPSTDSSVPPTYHRIGENVRIELVRGGVITGSVTNAAGEPVIAVTVRASMIRDANGRAAKMPFAFSLEQTTDDRGIYRIFGLLPGTYVVSAGGFGFAQRFQFSTYAYHIPTFAPSSTRDGAMEISVRAGEEGNADIRYRGEAGHAITGLVKFTGSSGGSISLTSPAGLVSGGGLFQPSFARNFEFYGLADGEYVIVARESTTGSAPGSAEMLMSEPRRITIKGADVTGLELVTKSLAALSGHVVLEPTKPAECESKRRPLLSEMVVTVVRPEKDTESDVLALYPNFNSGSPDAKGAFIIRNLMPGRYLPRPRFYAHYWYLNSMTIAGPPKIDAAANWTTLKVGERTEVTISLAAGAASIHGKLSGPNAPASLGIYLVPAERDKSADVLRYFMTSSEADGTFVFNNLPPGRYLVLTQTADAEAATIEKLRLPEAAETRAKLRRAAEAQKATLELKPCQNLTDYQLPPR